MSLERTVRERLSSLRNLLVLGCFVTSKTAMKSPFLILNNKLKKKQKTQQLFGEGKKIFQLNVGGESQGVQE